MTKTSRRGATIAIAIVLVTCAACAHRVAADVPGPWELRGFIVEVTASQLRIQHKTGQIVEILLDARTEVVRDERPAERHVLRRGARVRIVVEPLPEGRQRAQTIRVYGGGR